MAWLALLVLYVLCRCSVRRLRWMNCSVKHTRWTTLSLSVFSLWAGYCVLCRVHADSSLCQCVLCCVIIGNLLVSSSSCADWLMLGWEVCSMWRYRGNALSHVRLCACEHGPTWCPHSMFQNVFCSVWEFFLHQLFDYMCPSLRFWCIFLFLGCGCSRYVRLDLETSWDSIFKVLVLVLRLLSLSLSLLRV